MVALLILSKKDVPEPVHVGDFLQRHACPTRIPHFSVMSIAVLLTAPTVTVKSELSE